MEPRHPPPPPYSETDIYSNTSSHPILTPATSQADNASVAGNLHVSTASSIDDSVIYTPLHSPSGSDHQDGFGHASTTSALAYFESRPATSRSPPQSISHKISVTPRTRPDELPYQQNWDSIDITRQDWQTFVNHLLPDHTVAINNDIADRKLNHQLEMEESMHELSIGGDVKSRANMSEVDAQLDPLRQPLSPRSADYLSSAYSTVAEWNEGFFNPRGLHIIIAETELQAVAADGEMMRMPGAWISNDHEPHHETPQGNSGSGGRRGIFGSFRSFPGFRIGKNGLVADNEGFRIGKNGLVASSNGFRMGNMFAADHNGLRLGGARGFVADGHGVTIGGRAFGRRHERGGHWRGGGGSGGRGRGRHGHSQHDRHRSRSPSSSSSSSSSGPNAARRGHHRHARSHSHHGGHQRRSASASSSSSSASSDSVSSAGSLPDYDDIKDRSLPVAKQSLLNWLNHPDQPITKQTVKSISKSIKNAKQEDSKQQQQDVAVLRKEVKDLLRTFKEAKRAQKQQRKANKRARRAAKKQARNERRGARKEARKTDRQWGKSRDERTSHRGPPWARSQNHLPILTPAASTPLPTPAVPP
ncbi:hypothetical protein LSUE1_G006437, partial [Lachnellula suecica]